jgi:hypothetical protein
LAAQSAESIGFINLLTTIKLVRKPGCSMISAENRGDLAERRSLRIDVRTLVVLLI